MPVKKNILFDAKTNEYLFALLVNLTANQKDLLNPSELRIIRNQTELRRFVNNSPLDAKLSLLTKLGYDWALLFFNPLNFDVEDLKKVYKQYHIDDLPLENINEMIRKQWFVQSSKQAALAMAMADSNCHGEVWTINKEFIKRTDDMRDIDRKIAEKNSNVEYLTASIAMRRISKLLVAQAMLFENYATAVKGLQPSDLHILQLLFSKPNAFFREDVIQKRLKGLYYPVTVATRARKLHENDYLEKLPSASRKPAYQIKAKGILVVGDYLNKVVNTAMGEL